MNPRAVRAQWQKRVDDSKKKKDSRKNLRKFKRRQAEELPATDFRVMISRVVASAKEGPAPEGLPRVVGGPSLARLGRR